MRFEMGMFDRPEMIPYDRIPFSDNDSTANRELARRAAREAIVLLKNDGILPFKSSPKRIAVVGPLADSIPGLEGNYKGTSSNYVTPVAGIRAQSPKVTVTFVPGTKFLRKPVTIPASAFHNEDGKAGRRRLLLQQDVLRHAGCGTRRSPVGHHARRRVFRGQPTFGSPRNGRLFRALDRRPQVRGLGHLEFLQFDLLSAVPGDRRPCARPGADGCSRNRSSFPGWKRSRPDPRRFG